MERLDDLGGPTLVSWEDESGTARSVTSGDVNDLLTEVTGSQDITAKTFRT